MLIDFDFRHKSVLIIGEGREFETKIRQFLDAKANVIIATRKPSKSLEKLTKNKLLELVKYDPQKTWKKLAEKYDPYAVVLTNPNKLGTIDLAHQIRTENRSLLYMIDNPDLNNFNMPAIAKVGRIRVAISTGGLSPATASVLRKRVEETITTEDIRQVRLHAMMRPQIKRRISNAELRKICIYKIMRSKKINGALRKNKFATAKKLANKQIELILQRASKRRNRNLMNSSNH